jgi:hypothetical protein
MCRINGLNPLFVLEAVVLTKEDPQAIFTCDDLFLEEPGV